MTYTKTNLPKGSLLQKINEISFAVNDIHLFLDTHPCNERAMAFFQEMNEKRNQLLHEYACSYGPLTINTADDNECNTWQWIEQPFPWEQEGGCR